MSTVLLVEDDVPLRWALEANLRIGEFDVLQAGSGEEALRVAAQAHPDVMVLDLGLPGIDGMETLRRLRAVSTMPVVVLTVRDRLRDKVEALDAGADDFVVKPCDTPELLARVRAHLRRAPSAPTEQIFTYGDLVVDLDRRLVSLAGVPVHLTRVEMRLLETLVNNRGRLLTHKELLDAVWGTRPDSGHDRLRVKVLHLRRKLHDDAARPNLIFTEPGLGYRWIAEGEQDLLD
jgi:two-component system KDP operon response regulator KdpE